MNITTKTFEALSKEELYAILKLRVDVFVVEQDCPYPELDNKDQCAIHILGYEQSVLVAYARIFAPSDYFDTYAAIGRIATHAEYRNQSFGRKIVQSSIDNCRELYGKETVIKIAAQVYLNSFYKSFGFENDGEEFLEDGIPHVYMLAEIKRK